jgi:hypothetical protein
MAKKLEKNIVPETTAVETQVSPFASLTSTELMARVRVNVKERKRLSAENKELIGLHKATKAQEKSSSTEAKIAALTAQLEALKNHKK